MSQNSSFALKMSTIAKKQSEEMKEAYSILTDIFSSIILKIEAHDCKWDNTFMKVDVTNRTKLPFTIIDIQNFTTTMRPIYYKYLTDKFREFGFALQTIYFDGPFLTHVDLCVISGESPI